MTVEHERRDRQEQKQKQTSAEAETDKHRETVTHRGSHIVRISPLAQWRKIDLDNLLSD